MKEGLIRLTDEKDIFYDSIEKVYRYRMYCPNCKQVISTCICYNDLDVLFMDIDEGTANYTCSSKCTVLSWGMSEEVTEAMRELGFEKDLKECLKQLSDTHRMEYLQGYQIEDVLITLYRHECTIPIHHLKDPSTEEQIEIIIIMGDARDVLDNNEISYQPKLEDLTEEQARLITEFLSDNDDFDYPHGDACNI
jgi:hypothetical protein